MRFEWRTDGYYSWTSFYQWTATYPQDSQSFGSAVFGPQGSALTGAAAGAAWCDPPGTPTPRWRSVSLEYTTSRLRVYVDGELYLESSDITSRKLLQGELFMMQYYGLRDMPAKLWVRRVELLTDLLPPLSLPCVSAGYMGPLPLADGA